MRIIVVLGLVAGMSALAQSEVSLSTRAPEFKLKDPSGVEVSSANFTGKTCVVFFWMSSNPPSQRQLTSLVELQNDYAASNMTVLGLTLERNLEALKQFTTTNTVNFPILLADYDAIMGYGGLEAIPTIVVVEPHGVIVRRYVGVTDAATLRNIVKAIIESPR